MKKVLKWTGIIFVVLIAIGLFLGGGSDESSQTSSTSAVENSTDSEATETNNQEAVATTADTEKPAEKESSKYIKAGMYKVGKDLPAGEYLIIGDGSMSYYQVSKDSTGSLDSILTNDNFSNTRYVTVSDGQYIEFRNAKMILASEAEPQTNFSNGMYKVGKDIPAGEYKVAADGMGYFEVAKDSKGNIDSIVTNSNFEGEKYVTVKDGQYLKLQNCKLVK